MCQTLFLRCIPYKGEVQEATKKEYTQRQANTHKPLSNYAKDIEEVHTNTLEMGGWLARLEGMIRQLIHFIGDNNPQYKIVSSVPNGCKLSKDNITNAVEDDKALEEEVHFDVKGNAKNNVAHIGGLASGVVHDPNAKVHYLVNNIVDVGASNDVDMNAMEDIQPKAAENTLNSVSTLALGDAHKDAHHSIGKLTDPYFVLAQEVAPS